MRMRTKVAIFLICILLVAAAQIFLAGNIELDPQNPLSHLVIGIMRAIFAVVLLISVIVFALIALLSPLITWWTLLLISPIIAVIFYFGLRHMLNVLRKIRVPQFMPRINLEKYKLWRSKGRIDVGKNGFPYPSYYFSPHSVISWLQGDVEEGKISWQMYTLGALMALGASIGIIIFLFGYR